MVIKIRGDGTQYMSMLRDAAANTEGAAQVIQASAARVEQFVSTVKGLAESIVGLGTAYLSLSTLRAGFAAFGEHEKQTILLSAAIQGHGHDVQAATAYYKEFAKTMSETTMSSQEQVIGMLVKAENQYRLTGESAKKATQDAIYLAAGSGKSAEHLMMLTAVMARGDDKQALQMSRILTGGRGGGIKDINELKKLYAQMLETGKLAGGKELDTSSGQLTKLKQSYHELLIEVGNLIDGPAKKFISWIKEGVDGVLAFIERNRELPTIMADVRGALNGALEAAKNLYGGLGQGAASVGKFVEEHKKLVIVTASVVTGIGAAIIAFKLGTTAVGLMATAIAFLRVEEIISLGASIIVWAAYAAAVVAAEIAVGTYQAALWLLNTAYAAIDIGIFGTINLIGFLIGATTAEGAATIGATAATWLWNAALYVMDTLLGVSGVAVLALAGTVLVLTGALAVIGVLGYAGFAAVAAGAGIAWEGVKILWESLDKLGASASGPLQDIGDTLKEWGGMIADIAKAAQTDLDGAWKMAKAGFDLMVAEVKAIWPPLWTYVRTVAESTWALISAIAKAEWSRIMPTLKYEFLSTLNDLDGDAKNAFKSLVKGFVAMFLDGLKIVGEHLVKLFSAASLGGLVPGASLAIKGLRAAISGTDKEAAAQQQAADKATADTKTSLYQRTAQAKVDADKNAEKAIADSRKVYDDQLAATAAKYQQMRMTGDEEEIRAARDNYEYLKGVAEENRLAAEIAADSAKKPFDDTAASADKAVHAVHGLTHALAGSAEENRRIEHQRALFDAAREGKSGVDAKIAASGNATGAGTAAENRNIEATNKNTAALERNTGIYGNKLPETNKLTVSFIDW